MKSAKDRIHIECIIRNTYGDIIKVITTDKEPFNLDQLINRVRHNDITVFADNTDDYTHRLIPREIGKRWTLRSLIDDSFRLENIPECNENK